MGLILNKEQIKDVIPHRDNMLLIDEAEIVDELHSKGKLHIKGDEWFLQGHFPGNPIVPGVILCEAMAQTSSVIIMEKSRVSTPFFASIKNARFKEKVLPGNTFESECTLIRNKGVFYFIESKGFVNGKLCVSAEFSFALIERV